VSLISAKQRRAQFRPQESAADKLMLTDCRGVCGRTSARSTPPHRQDYIDFLRPEGAFRGQVRFATGQLADEKS
jgi:hypothetical protein